jgi:signal transduction histidine kinase
MGDMRPGSPDNGVDRPAWFRQSREVAFASAILISDLFFFSDITQPGPSWWQRLLEAGWAILGYAPLRWRNSSPLAAYGLGLAYSIGGALLTILGVFDFTPFSVLMVNLFFVASARSLRVSCLALAAAVAPTMLSIWYSVRDEASPNYWISVLIGSADFYLLLIAMAWAMGRWSRSALDTMERQRRRLALADEAARAERQRIARELHDILAHTVTVMVLQAAGARRVLASAPASADDALSRIEEVGKTAMGELRRMLALIRSPGLTNDEPSQRGLADIGGLLDDALRAGVTVRLEVDGSPVPLPDSVDRTVYRIAQEAVTNIVKHSGPGTAALVRLTWETNLHIEVVDDGGGSPVMDAGTFSTGQGLLGLAERVAAFGGAFAAGPHRSGFRVRASLPLLAPDSYVSWPSREAGQ